MKLSIFDEYTKPVSLIFSNTSEYIEKNLEDEPHINTPFNQPIGTFILEILNTDIKEISELITNCKAPSPPRSMNLQLFSENNSPHYWLCDVERFSAVYEILSCRLPSLLKFYDHYDLNSSWHLLSDTFCSKNDSNEFTVVQQVSALKSFLTELSENNEFFSFDFLEYLDIIGRVPFGTPPRTILDNRHKQGEQAISAANLTDLYAIFKQAPFQTQKEYVYETYIFAIVESILICSLLELARQWKIIRICQNCGRYFIPENRTDTIYCNNTSPQDCTRTCKQYGAQRLWYERQKDDELATLSRNILSAKSMLAKRNPDIPAYTLSYDYFRIERKKWKQDVVAGYKAREEYRTWLLSMQSQKIIKEAIDGDN